MERLAEKGKATDSKYVFRHSGVRRSFETTSHPTSKRLCSSYETVTLRIQLVNSRGKCRSIVDNASTTMSQLELFNHLKSVTRATFPLMGHTCSDF